MVNRARQPAIESRPLLPPHSRGNHHPTVIPAITINHHTLLPLGAKLLAPQISKSTVQKRDSIHLAGRGCTGVHHQPCGLRMPNLDSVFRLKQCMVCRSTTTVRVHWRRAPPTIVLWLPPPRQDALFLRGSLRRWAPARGRSSGPVPNAEKSPTSPWGSSFMLVSQARVYARAI